MTAELFIAKSDLFAIVGGAEVIVPATTVVTADSPLLKACPGSFEQLVVAVDEDFDTGSATIRTVGRLHQPEHGYTGVRLRRVLTGPVTVAQLDAMI